MSILSSGLGVCVEGVRKSPPKNSRRRRSFYVIDVLKLYFYVASRHFQRSFRVTSMGYLTMTCTRSRLLAHSISP